MNRLKQIAGALMLLVPLAACDEGTPPPPTGSIEGTVTIEGTGADGVTVTLNDGMTTTTAGGGAYRFAGVEGGAYTVTISGYPSDANFDATQASATIASANQVVQVNFSGSYIRTSSILGAATLEGEGLSGLTVSLSGMSEGTTTTADDGAFAFTGLRAGTYTVELSGFDAEAYSFSNTSHNATVAVGASAEVNFAATHIRTASIRGTVMVGEDGLSGVLVSLTGVSEATATTDDAGSYEFENLQEGSYTVAISGFNAREYGFEVTTQNVSLDVGEAANLNFEGTALRNAGVTGRIYVDETNRDSMFTAGEELEVAGVMVVLTGPGVADVDTTMTDAEGMYGFDSLEAGSYRVRVEHAAAMADTAVKLPSYLAYKGRDNYLVTMEASDSSMVDFPFMIATQKVMVRAMYGADSANMGGPAAGVRIDLHATSAQAQAAGMGSLGRKTTDSMGYAMFEFSREDDIGPGGGLVYARATALANTSLSSAADMPIEYASTAHDVKAKGMFTLLSTQAMLELSVANRSNDGNSGGDPMSGWTVYVWTDLAKAKAAATDTSMMSDAMDTLTSAARTGMVAKTYADVKRGDKYYIRIGGTAETTETQDTSLTRNESFKSMASAGEDGAATTMALDTAATTPATSFLVYTHTGLEPPATKMDVGMFHLTYTTQTLVVGVHHERDNVPGFSDISPGDVRPTGTDLGSEDIKIGLFELDPVRGYPTPLTDDDGEDLPATAVTATSGGMITWTGLDSDKELVLEVTVTGNKKAIGATRLNVFGDIDRGDDDGTTGVFGGGGGLMPRVHFCPESRKAGMPPRAYMDGCSTFAYKFTDNTIVVHTQSKEYTDGAADQVAAAGQGVSVKAILPSPGARSPKDQTTAATGMATFSNLVDGRYVVTTTEDTTGNWKFARNVVSTDTVLVLGGEAANMSMVTRTKTMTFQKTMIQGNVVRDGFGGDSFDNEEADDGETRAGLKVNLVEGSGRTAKVVATATTDRNGQFELEAPEGTYRVGGPSGDDYILCHKSLNAPLVDPENCSDHSNNTRLGVLTTEVTTTAKAAERTYERDTTLPGWQPWDQSITDGGDDTDFIVLFASSTLEGNVKQIVNPAGGGAPDTTNYKEVEVVAFRCLTANPGAAVNTRCTTRELTAHKTVQTDSLGNWEMTELLEGIYRVLVNAPGETSDPPNYETSNPVGDNSGGGRPLRGANDRRRNLDFHVTRN